MKKLLVSTVCLLLTTIITLGLSPKETREVADYLQDISVTIRSEGEYSKSEGSGILITRNISGEKVTFVWTCAHVVDNLRSVRTVIERGTPLKIVEFDDVRIIKELVEGGRRVGEINMDARVIKFSDADEGEDLALLMVRAKDYGKASGKFYLEKDSPIIPIGTNLFHVGSLLGQMGSNSMTSGIVSQVGRIHGKVEFDQTTVTAFPGSSGGGVFLQDGTYVGMIVRGAGEGFNLMVPVRRMIRYAKKHDILWALDPKVKMPSMDDINDLPVESVSDDDDDKKKPSSKKKAFEINFPHLIRTLEINTGEIDEPKKLNFDTENPATLKFR
jgi:S1-C subfamily serine protease